MNINKTSQDLVCFITNCSFKKLETENIASMIRYVLNDEKKPLADNAYIVYYNTITDIIDDDKNRLRAVVICPNNVNIKTEINKIKQDYFNIKIMNKCYLNKDIYFVIDVIPCPIADLKHNHHKKCTNLYTIYIGQGSIVNGEDKVPYYKIVNIY